MTLDSDTMLRMREAIERAEARSSQITRESVWMTADGRGVAIKDMTDSHLLNLIRCFRDMSPIGTKVNPPPGSARGRQWLNVLANEAYARGLSLDELTEGEPVHE